jgi:putative phosphoribosyl transferase
MNPAGRDAMAKVRIVSYSREPFQDRSQAGQLLAQELSHLQGKKAIVLGIPRGGIVVARALADEIGADVDIVLSRKLGAPEHPELALGALAEDGEVFLNQYVLQELMIPEAYIAREKERQMEEIKRRSQLIRRVLPKLPLKGRIAVVTDDGVATGATMQVALWAIRRERPRKLIAAMPVASEEAVARLSKDVDELVCLRMPPYFMAVGQFYLHFDQVTDEEVLEILRQEKRRNNIRAPSQ